MPANPSDITALFPPGLELTPELIRAAARNATIEMAWRAAEKGDILTWGKLLFPAKFPIAFCKEMHGYFVDIAEDPFTVTEAPRGRAKTTIRCFLIPIFLALNHPERYDYFLNVQGTEKKALSINRAIQHELETNRLLIEMYGDQHGPRWTDEEFELSNGVVFKAVSAGQDLRGLNYENRRPRYIVVDDLYTTADIHNQESTKKKNEWLMGELYPARAQFGKTCFHLQGTAINLWDLLHLFKTVPLAKHRTFKAVLDWENKVVLWPELKTFDEMMEEKELMLANGEGSIIWFREFQNERHDDASSFIKRAWLYPENGARSWERRIEDFKFASREILFLECRIGNDPSIGDKVENDYTGIVLVWKLKHADSTGAFYFIVDIWNEHLSQNERILLMDRIYKGQPTDRPVRRAYVEGIAGFKDYVAELKRRTSMPVMLVDRVKDKISNLEAKSSLFENGQVFMNSAIAPKLKDMLVYQLTTNHPNHDDVRDALFLAVDQPTNSLSWAA